MRIAAFGFRSLPSRAGSAGAEKFASELYPRLVQRGHGVVAYTRVTGSTETEAESYEGVEIVPIRTISRGGFDTLLHSFKSTIHILRHDTGDVIHIHNGGNSMWALPLRLAGKRVFVSQDGVDWKREKWPWYGKLFLWLSSYLTALIPHGVIFDNIYARDWFAAKFKKPFHYVPYGSEIPAFVEREDIFRRFGIEAGEFFLFVGRFIPDKGVHYLVSAFKRVQTRKKLVLVGGAPNASEYERDLRQSEDPRVIFTGFLYGDEVLTLMKHAYLYVQPSDVEGLSPVILTIMGMGTPLLCSDIRENVFAVKDTALLFRQGNVDSLQQALASALANPQLLAENASRARARAETEFNWEKTADEHVALFGMSP